MLGHLALSMVRALVYLVEERRVLHRGKKRPTSKRSPDATELYQADRLRLPPSPQTSSRPTSYLARTIRSSCATLGCAKSRYAFVSLLFRFHVLSKWRPSLLLPHYSPLPPFLPAFLPKEADLVSVKALSNVGCNCYLPVRFVVVAFLHVGYFSGRLP
jgi:hypothetical protein